MLSWGGVRAEGAEAWPPHRTPGVGSGRHSCRILWEWRPLEFMPRSVLSVHACDYPTPHFLALPAPPLPVYRDQKEVITKGKEFAGELTLKRIWKNHGPCPPAWPGEGGALHSHSLSFTPLLPSLFLLTSLPVFSSLRTFDPASEELSWRR